MKFFHIILGIVASIFIAAILLFVAALMIDPRAGYLILALFDRPWLAECEKHPVAEYLSGSYHPCTGTPLTTENANIPTEKYSKCPLELATSYGNYSGFEELIMLGASPRICPGNSAHLYEMIVNRNCHSEEKLAEKFLSKLDSIGESPPNPKLLFDNSIRFKCMAGLKLSLNNNATLGPNDLSALVALYETANITEDGIRMTELITQSGVDAKASIPGLDESPYMWAKRFYGKSEKWPELESALLGAPVE